jgi:hypothetical protein
MSISELSLVWAGSRKTLHCAGNLDASRQSRQSRQLHQVLAY